MPWPSIWRQLAIMLLMMIVPTWAQTLDGVIDMHAHSDPDGTPRSIDAIDLARLAKSRGMRALVLKNHYEPTASLAYIVRKEVPGIEVFGGISLDLTVGGVNPAAVEWMTKVKGGYGRVVWMPTFDSEAQVTLTHQKRPFARVSKDGKLVPEVLQVIAIASRSNLVLETGHSSPGECLLLIEEAKRQGVKHIMVTHALTNPGGPLSIAEIQAGREDGRIHRTGVLSVYRRGTSKGCRCDPRGRGGIRRHIERSRTAGQSSPSRRIACALPGSYRTRHLGSRNRANDQGESSQIARSGAVTFLARRASRIGTSGRR